MEDPRSWKHWRNPVYGSETDSTAYSSKSAPEKVHAEKDMSLLLQCISQRWKTIKSMPSASSFASTGDREVVMEGYLPTTKQSLLNFLKGMGLKPKVDVVGKETVITADASEIRDAVLKQRFIRFMKKQVTSAGENGHTDASSSSLATSATSKPTSSGSWKSENSSGPSKASSSSEPSVGHSKMWTPPKYTQELGTKDKKKNKKKTDVTASNCGKTNDKKGTKIIEKDADKKKDEKKKSVGFKTVGMVPVVGNIDNPFERQIPIDTHIASTSEDEELNELEQVHNQYSCGSSVGVAMAKPHSLARPKSVQDPPSRHEQQNTTACDETTKTQKKKKKLRIMKHIRKWFSKKENPRQQASPAVGKDDDCEEGQNSVNTIPIGIHTNSIESYDLNPVCHFQTVSVAREPDRAPLTKLLAGNKIPERNRNLDPGMQSFKSVDVSRNNVHNSLKGRDNRSANLTSCLCYADGVPVTDKLYVETNRNRNKRENNRLNKMKMDVQTFDGSISMPVLIAPDQSCFKTKQDLLEASKSSTRVAENVQANGSYSVVGDSAAIHIGKKRIRLEGKDVKYGSILQTDQDFDERIRVLKDNSLTDIEKQVRKVKERIMFARAMGAVGDRLPEGAPKVNYEELLVPEKIKQDGSRFHCRSHLNLATTTSFYQKFLASMNILKTTHRFDVCDRSVMTDEPLSKTYAEFINVMDRRNAPRKKSSSAANSSQSRTSQLHVTNGDSSIDLPATSYLKMICTCWEPLFKFFPDHENVSMEHSPKHRPPENNRTEDEKILKCIVDKVLDCSKNKKGYIKT